MFQSFSKKPVKIIAKTLAESNVNKNKVLDIIYEIYKLDHNTTKSVQIINNYNQYIIKNNLNQELI